MKMSGEQTIAAPREAVWQALNDPEVLRQCIPGCESVDKTGDDSFDAKVTAKVGPVKAKFAGSVTLSDLDPPNGYTISGEGKGGAAGFAKGGAKVKLTDSGDGGTVLTYDVDAQVGGKLAQLGARLIDGTAKKMAGEFFESFGRVVEGGAEPAEDAVPAVPAEPATPAEPAAQAQPGATARPAEAAPPTDENAALNRGMPSKVWILLLVIAVVIILTVLIR